MGVGRVPVSPTVRYPGLPILPWGCPSAPRLGKQLCITGVVQALAPGQAFLVAGVRSMADKVIPKDELRIGLYVHLDLPWMQHPFLTNSFKVRTATQLQALKRLGLDQVRYDPERSDPAPPPRARQDAAAAPPPDDLEQALWQEKQRRIEVLKERRTRLNHCASRYSKSVGSVRKLMSHLFAVPAQAVEEAEQVVTGMVEELTADREVALQLVNMKSQDESSYFHVINVAALALMLGKGLGLNRSQLSLLGIAALFHDLGHQQIPSQVLRKREPLTPAEQQLYQRHPLYGEQIALRLGTLPKEAVAVILQHHEHLNGTGYPRGLRRDAIVPLARIVAVVNRYDNLCNRGDGAHALSPYEAVSQMYAREREQYDQKVLTHFITHLGVYPPGSVVRLSDGRIACVVSINPGELLKPNVLVYDRRVPKEEALILDLTEESLGITESCRRGALDPDMVAYFNLSDSLTYYFDRAVGPGAGRRRL
jgi:HD-GYP domain-containing protein (c-di-GMP phosphodiesterase class II)